MKVESLNGIVYTVRIPNTIEEKLVYYSVYYLEKYINDGNHFARVTNRDVINGYCEVKIFETYEGKVYLIYSFKIENCLFSRSGEIIKTDKYSVTLLTDC